MQSRGSSASLLWAFSGHLHIAFPAPSLLCGLSLWWLHSFSSSHQTKRYITSDFRLLMAKVVLGIQEYCVEQIPDVSQHRCLQTYP